jgi:carboxyl-terminal processing protease
MEPQNQHPNNNTSTFNAIKAAFMKFRGPIFLSLALAAALWFAFVPKKISVNGDDKEAMLMKLILTFVEQLHFNPKSLDDKFSENLYDLYIKNLDGYKRFLTQDDLKKLEGFRNQLDDEAKTGEYEFFDLSLQLYDAAVKKNQTYYREILSKPLDLSTAESFETDPEKRSFPKNDAEVKALWHKLLKYEILGKILDKEEGQKQFKPGDANVSPKTTAQIEEEARKDLLKSYDDYFDRLGKLKRSDRLSTYLNCVTHLFDPHTDFFEPVDKQDFDINMSGRLEGIGARLQNVGDFTKVSEIVVGGPAWKGKELQEGDMILKAAQGDSEEWKDFTGMLTNEVVTYVRGKKGTKVRLQVKKADGSTKEISITRDEVIFDETYAKSLILDSSNGKDKIGFIYLPKFYADFQNANGRYCAPDVAAEIEKLKADQVKGIVIDLRNNGGGSLNDVVKMSGFFIENGPIVQVKSRNTSPEILNDRDPAVKFNGPLVIMVNNYSASASEIMAAALQDYGRAIIVGSKSTYGKGTVQRFFSLDQAVSESKNMAPLGDIKITLQKYYRINGGSTQLRGVVPDIILPDSYHYLPLGEREEDYPLEWTEIKPAFYSQNVYKIKNLDALKKRSQERISQDPGFQKILEQARYLDNERKNSSLSLRLEDFRKMNEEDEKRNVEYRNSFKDVVNSNVRNAAADVKAIESAQDDGKTKAKNKEFIEGVSKDIYIRETLKIMQDMIDGLK